jgi:hypothetical protein
LEEQGNIYLEKRHSRSMSVGCPERFGQDCSFTTITSSVS